MKGSIDLVEQLKTAIKTAYQHGPMSWTQLKVMLSIVDPVLDSVLSKKYDDVDINRLVFSQLYNIVCAEAHEDEAICKRIEDTLLQLFCEQDFVTLLDLKFKDLAIIARKFTCYGSEVDSDFVKQCYNAICKRTIVSTAPAEAKQL